MTFQEIFQEARSSFINTDVSEYKENISAQINLTGQGAGVFYAKINNGRLFIETGEYENSYENSDVSFTVNSDDFLKLIRGKMNPITAFTFGKIKADGNISKVMELAKLMSKK